MPPRLLLDADIAPAVAKALRAHGYDVVSARQDLPLERLTDEALLAHASREGRVLVTYNVRDFLLLSRQLAQAERAHEGIIVVHAKTIPQVDIGGLVRALDALLGASNPGDLRNRTLFLTRAQP